MVTVNDITILEAKIQIIYELKKFLTEKTPNINKVS